MSPGSVRGPRRLPAPLGRVRLGRLALVAAAGLAGSSCEDLLLNDPGVPGPVTVVVAARAGQAVQAQDLQAVLERADQLTAAFTPLDGGSGFAQTVPLTFEGGEARARFEVEVSGSLPFRVELRVLYEGAPLFAAVEEDVELRAGVTVQVAPTLDPEVASVEITPVEPLRAPGEEVEIEATAFFATGDVLEDAAFTFESLEPGVLSRVGGASSNRFRGEAEGTAQVRVTATAGTIEVDEAGNSATTTVEVEPAPVLAPQELCSDYPDAAIATFEDANLEAAVRGALGVTAGEELTCGSLATLTSLTASDAGITTLVGIQNLSGLTFLDLNINPISDIGPLGALTSLTELNLVGNSIGDIGPLSALTSLTELDLGGNSVSDIGPLSGLTGLTHLYMGSNSIGDISPLSALTSLIEVHLSGNSISDIGPLSGLTSLTDLHLFDNSISDISPLSGLTSLTVLNLRSNSISDLGPLSALTSLTELYLHANSISEIGPLSALTSLRFLRLDSNSISDIGPLGGLADLAVVFLSLNGDLSDIQPLLDNTGLGTSDEVHLESTNVSCADGAALQAKGVTVFHDCQPVALKPINGEKIEQNNPDIGCSPHPTAGYGHRIEFEWRPVDAADRYELFAKNRSAQNPIVETTVVGANSYTYTSCNSYVTTANLTGWEWRVRAVFPGGVEGPWSLLEEFEFEPCILASGEGCG